MGKMKELDIELQSQENDNQLPPPPDQIDINTNQSMWVIDGYKIWASSYTEAVQLLPIIQSF